MFLENTNTNYVSLLKEKFPRLDESTEGILRYVDEQTELNSLKHGVGAKIHFSRSIIKIMGKDVLDYLHRVSTNNVYNLAPNSAIGTLFLNEKGRFIDSSILLHLEHEFLLIGNTDPHRRLLNWINKFIIVEEIHTFDQSDKLMVIDFFGPQSHSFLTMILGSEIDKVVNDSVKRFDVDGFTFYIFLNKIHENINSYSIIIERDKCNAFVDYLIGITGAFDFSFVGETAFAHYRIINKMAAFPNEINDLTNPYEAELISNVSFTKGCYIGQEVIARLDTYDKIQRQLIIMSSTEFSDNLQPDIYDAEQNVVGQFTTLSSFSKSIFGLALVKKKSISNQVLLFAVNNGKMTELEIEPEH
jgi:folate-binding protein YgfZ